MVRLAQLDADGAADGLGQRLVGGAAKNFHNAFDSDSDKIAVAGRRKASATVTAGKICAKRISKVAGHDVRIRVTNGPEEHRTLSSHDSGWTDAIKCSRPERTPDRLSLPAPCRDESLYRTKPATRGWLMSVVAPHRTSGCRKPRTYFDASAASMACVTSGASGFTADSKRFRILPSRLTRNLVKFHLMSPAVGESGPARMP